jgi:hypothetical protein
MLRKIAIALAAATLIGAAAIPTDALAFGGGHGGGAFHGGGGFHGGFGGGGFRGGFVGHGFGGRGFAGRGFFGPGIGLGLGLGLGYYGGRCYAWTPYGYRWVCGYPYY